MKLFPIVIAALVWAGAAGAAGAADRPLYGPPAAWVKPIAIPDIPTPADGAAVQVLLEDHQAKFSADGDDVFVETAS